MKVCSSGLGGDHDKHADDPQFTCFYFIEMALCWALKMETYQNPGETSEAIMDKVYRSWIFKWYRNPKALVAWMKTTFWRVSDSDRDRENYEMVFGQDTRPLLEKFIDYLKTTDGREPVELGECVLETLLRRRTVRIANIYFLCWLFVIRLSIDTDWLRLIQKLKPHQIRKRNGTLRVEMRHYTTAPPTRQYWPRKSQWSQKSKSKCSETLQLVFWFRSWCVSSGKGLTWRNCEIWTIWRLDTDWLRLWFRSWN